MLPSLALLVATLVAAEPTGGADAAIAPEDPLLSAIPAHELGEALMNALPPPPSVVVRETRYYGSVTIDHAKHLARRASCFTCHDRGRPVNKLSFTPKVAHTRCIGCHQEQKKGPTKCQGCHVKPPPAPSQLTAAAGGPGTPAAPAPAAEPNPKNVAAALAAFDAPPASGPGLFKKEPFQRYLEVGLAAGRGLGASVRLASHQDSILVSQSIERQSYSGGARTIGMVGAGLSHGRGRLSFEGVCLAGFDVVERPEVSLLPALGARAGVEVRLPHGVVRRLAASLTGIVDLSSGRAGAGGVTFYGTVATGFGVP